MTRLNVDNRTIFCHDNLDVLQGINSGSVDLIYLDPPFNKNKRFTAPVESSASGAYFDDIFKEEDVKDEWIQTIKEDQPELYTYLSGIRGVGKPYNFAYLAYMAIRLIECHRILKVKGSIYLHCDPTMSHYLKTTMDCIFGEENFRNEFIWYYSGGGASKRSWAKKHDVILFYSFSETWTFNANSVRTPYKWDKGQKRADGSKRDYEKGKLADDVWQHHSVMPWAQEHTGYPTQKPLALLERIIKASSNAGDIVLDPFCGCATTCVAAEHLGRQWVGIDTSIKAFELVKERLTKEAADPEDILKYKNEAILKTEPPQRTDQGDDHRESKYIYVISHPSYPGEYKVGIARDPKARLNQYQTGSPDRAYNIEFQHQTSDFRETEAHIHDKFNNRHEWVTGELGAIIDAIKTYRP